MRTTGGKGTAGELGRQALDWMLAQGHESTIADEPNPTLYRGTAGVLLALLEGLRHFGDERDADGAPRGARLIAEHVEAWEHDSLYFGLAGRAFVLRTVQRQCGDEASGTAADLAPGTTTPAAAARPGCRRRRATGSALPAGTTRRSPRRWSPTSRRADGGRGGCPLVERRAHGNAERAGAAHRLGARTATPGSSESCCALCANPLECGTDVTRMNRPAHQPRGSS
jgi:hypothetical protein